MNILMPNPELFFASMGGSSSYSDAGKVEAGDYDAWISCELASLYLQKPMLFLFIGIMLTLW